MRADSAVEPTKSENITVIWRRSARSAGETLGAVDVVAASAEGTLPPLSARTAATERQPRGGLCASASPIMLHRMGPFLAHRVNFVVTQQFSRFCREADIQRAALTDPIL